MGTEPTKGAGPERTVLKAVRPVANRVAPFELPPDRYFVNVKQLFAKLEGIDALLGDPKVTSGRLATNPEKMVIRQSQRAFTYFPVYGLVVDQVIVNRVLPAEVRNSFFSDWRRSQERALDEIELFKKGDELVVEIGAIRRHVELPTSLASLVPARARLEDGTLIVKLKEAES